VPASFVDRYAELSRDLFGSKFAASTDADDDDDDNTVDN
jgi:hypothetical protein